jgi:3-oxoacyl-[acyl-carrier-protein] synthase II
MDKKVVITGLGVLSPVAIGRDAYWEALFQGKTGFRSITLTDTATFHTRLAGEITDFDALTFLGKKGLRDLDRSTRLISSAAKLAIEDSGLEVNDKNNDAIGVSIGTTFGSLHSISQFDRSGLIEGPRAVNPSQFPNTVINSPASQVSIRFNMKAFNTTISTGFCAGLDAVAYAADFIKLNRANVVLAGGVEELCEEIIMVFEKFRYLSGTNGSNPLCCPFDARRNGTLLSEGAVVLVLEDEAYAGNRGAAVLARIAGYANAFDPRAEMSFSHPGEGLRKAIMLALNDASLKPTDIDYICASANSSVGLDRMETAAIKHVFGNHAYNIPVSSIKSMIGESYSASGALALAAATGCIQKQSVTPTVNYLEKDPACDLDYVPGVSRKRRLNNILVLAADPYGQNSAVIVGA